jgi:hypothetical protein
LELLTPVDLGIAMYNYQYFSGCFIVVNSFFVVVNSGFGFYQQENIFYEWNDLAENGIKWNKIVFLHLLKSGISIYGNFCWTILCYH